MPPQSGGLSGHLTSTDVRQGKLRIFPSSLLLFGATYNENFTTTSTPNQYYTTAIYKTAVYLISIPYYSHMNQSCINFLKLFQKKLFLFHRLPPDPSLPASKPGLCHFEQASRAAFDFNLVLCSGLTLLHHSRLTGVTTLALPPTASVLSGPTSFSFCWRGWFTSAADHSPASVRQAPGAGFQEIVGDRISGEQSLKLHPHTLSAYWVRRFQPGSSVSDFASCVSGGQSSTTPSLTDNHSLLGPSQPPTPCSSSPSSKSVSSSKAVSSLVVIAKDRQITTSGPSHTLWQSPRPTGAIHFARSEGIIPAAEPTHAIAATIKESLCCKETGKQG